MKRKLGVALLIVATALAGTPEAVKQFHDLNRQVRAWASTNLGGSFLVYAETTNERALPDRYDYHEVAPITPRTNEPAASSYGLMASLTLPTASKHTPCPFARQRAALQMEALSHAQPIEQSHTPAIEQRATAQTLHRTTRTLTVHVRRDELARQIERATDVAARALGTKLDAKQFAAIIRAQSSDLKVKTLRIKTTTAALKAKRGASVPVARTTEEEALPAVPGFEFKAPLPSEIAWTRRGVEEESGRVPAVEPVKRSAAGRARTRNLRPGVRAVEPREFDVAPFVIMASSDGETKGFNCNGKDN